MRRRDFITLLGGAAVTTAWPLAARAQQADDMRIIGILLAGSMNSYARILQSFRNAMRELGYDEERNIRFEYRFADGYLDRLSGLAAELVRLKPSVIVSAETSSTLAARRATSSIPIVMASNSDPVGFGLVASLSRPGGNVTGLANLAELLAPKQLDVLRDLIAGVSRIAMLINLSNVLHESQLRETQAAATHAGISLVLSEIRAPEELEAAFAYIAREKVEALLVPPDILFYTFRRKIADLAAAARLPTIYGYREHVVEGGLISYGPDHSVNYRRAATYVDKILRGAQPADLPVEQPTKFELVINLETASALGLKVPQMLLATAEEVIE